MKKESLFRCTILLILLLTNYLLATKEKCDTSYFLGDTTIECRKSNCPKDSILIFITSSIISKEIFPNCRDSSVYITLSRKNHDTLGHSTYKGEKKIGLSRIYYSANRPKQFTHYNDSGQKHGWEVSWYDNGNVKDSTLYQNDTLIRGKIFYYNGGLKSVAENVNNRQLYSASSYSPTGQKTGTIRNGTGIIYSCDSLGNNCHRIVYRDGKYIYNESD